MEVLSSYLHMNRMRIASRPLNVVMFDGEVQDFDFSRN